MRVLSGMFYVLELESRRFESTSSRCVATFDNCLLRRQRETTSLISFPGGVEANEPAFRRIIVIIIIIIVIITSLNNQIRTRAVQNN